MDLRTDSENINSLVFITEVESVYSAVRTESLYNTDTFRLLMVNNGFIFNIVSANVFLNFGIQVFFLDH